MIVKNSLGTLIPMFAPCAKKGEQMTKNVYVVVADRETIIVLNQLCEKRPEDYKLVEAGLFYNLYRVNADTIHWKPGTETGVIE